MNNENTQNQNVSVATINNTVTEDFKHSVLIVSLLANLAAVITWLVKTV